MWYHCSGFVTIGLRMRRDSCKVQHCQHTATHCNTLQHTATHCSTLKRTTTRCNTLKHTGAACTMGLPQYVQNSGTHTAINSRNTLHHTAIYCNAPRIFEHFQKNSTAVWRTPIKWLIFACHSPQKRLIIDGWFADRDQSFYGYLTQFINSAKAP